MNLGWKIVYLDNNATTPLSRRVRKEMCRVLRKYYGNPSALYYVGHEAALKLEKSREEIARVLKVKADELTFTGSATESNNQILVSLFEQHYPQKKRIIASPIEHPAVLETLKYLEGRGAEVKLLSVDRHGRIDLKELETLINAETILVSVMLANNELGTLEPISQIATLAHRHNAFLMCDCVQGLAKVPVELKEWNVDYAVFSAHKINGPKGIGLLYCKERNALGSFVHGGLQEKGLRAGTEAVALAAGFAKAVAEVPHKLKKAPKINALKGYLKSELLALLPDLQINTPDQDCLPNTLNITFSSRLDNALLMGVLDYYGISVSAGSACHTGSDEPSHVLKAIGLSDEEARNSMRISLSAKTRKGQLRFFIRTVRHFFTKGFNRVKVLKPDKISSTDLAPEKVQLIDIRFDMERKIIKSLPGALEVNYFTYSKALKKLDKKKPVIVTCHTGRLSPIIAFKLLKRGFHDVSYVMMGLLGVRLQNPGLLKG